MEKINKTINRKDYNINYEIDNQVSGNIKNWKRGLVRIVLAGLMSIVPLFTGCTEELVKIGGKCYAVDGFEGMFYYLPDCDLNGKHIYVGDTGDFIYNPKTQQLEQKQKNFWDF